MPRRPNVVWITVESTRADHTTMGGYRRDTTPEMQRIADRPRGRSFDSCFAHGIWTLSSTASILTGTYPSHHGAGMQNDAIPDRLPTVPELLGEAGYTTACLSPNSHLSEATGLARGFDRFAWVSKSTLLESLGPRALGKYALNVRRHGGGFDLDSRKHGAGLDYMMADVARRWLGELRDDQPFFTYLHLGGPHHPYHPPRRFAERYAAEAGTTPEAASEVALDHHEHLFERVAEGCPFSEAEWAALQAFYDGEIAHADELVGDLFDHVESLDLDDTVFIVTADHGELFGEHGLLAHVIVADDAVSHVPLVVHGLPDLADGFVQHADVMATLLELAGAPTDGLQGVDLREESRDRAIVQRGGPRCRKNLAEIERHAESFDASRFHRERLTAVRTASFKYQRSEEGAELFRLPDETADVADEHPDVAADLDESLSAWLETTGRPLDESGAEAEFTDAMAEQLADLGYLVD